MSRYKYRLPKSGIVPKDIKNLEGDNIPEMEQLSKLIMKRSSHKATLELTAPEVCLHTDLHEIGTDFDQKGMMLRLVRCQLCGLLMRQYLSMV